MAAKAEEVQITGVYNELELPYEQDGKVDWNTLGNILTAHNLGEVLLASYVDCKYGREYSDFRPATDWMYDYEKDGIVVLKKDIPNSPLKCFMGRGVINFPLRDLATFLKDVKQNFKWDKLLVDAQYLQVLSQSGNHSDFIGYQRYEATHCFTAVARDALYYVRCINTDNKYVQSSISIQHPDYPRHRNIPRIDVRVGSGYVLEPYLGSESKTLMSYLAHVDMKELPAAIMNLTLRKVPLAISNIARHVGPHPPTTREISSWKITKDELNKSTVAVSDATDSAVFSSGKEGSDGSKATATGGSDRSKATATGGSEMHMQTWNKSNLPTGRDGRVDWDTLGKILTAHILGEVLCASYIDTKHRKTEDFRADTEWEFVYEKSNVVVLKKRLKESPLHCFMGRGVIDVPMREVAEFVKNIDSTFVWDKFCVEAKFLRVLSESESHVDYIGTQKFESTQCFTAVKRDSLYYARCIYLDGKYIQTVISIDDPDYPPTNDSQRVEIHRGSGFVIEPYMDSSTRTLVSYLAHADLKRLPVFIMNQVLKQHPMIIHQIRRYLMRQNSVQVIGSVRGKSATSWRKNRRTCTVTTSSVESSHDPAADCQLSDSAPPVISHPISDPPTSSQLSIQAPPAPPALGQLHKHSASQCDLPQCGHCKTATGGANHECSD